jgi:hypothetical protein
MKIDLIQQTFDSELSSRLDIQGPGCGLRFGYSAGTINTTSGASQSASAALPAGAVILGAVAKVITAITTTGVATNCEIGLTGDTDAFGSKAFSAGVLALGTDIGGVNHVGTGVTTTAAIVQGTALAFSIGVTGGGTFTGGAVKYCIFYCQIQPFSA